MDRFPRGRCGCGRLHTAARPDGTRPGLVGYGPNLQAFAVYLMVVHFVPVKRCVELLESLTGASRPIGGVRAWHALSRAAGLLAEADKRIRALITLAYAVCCDETPLRPEDAETGAEEAQMHLLVACTELNTHYLLGDRNLDTFKAFVLADLTGSVIVHDRYHLYDSAEIGELTHQLCCQHLLRDLVGAAQTLPRRALAGPDRRRAARPDPPGQPRDAGRDTIDPAVRDELIKQFTRGAGRAVRHHQPRQQTRPAQGPAATGGAARPRSRLPCV